MPEQNTNSFEELNTDMHPYNTKNNVMTDALNATLVTKGENQFILQNLDGNELAAELSSTYINKTALVLATSLTTNNITSVVVSTPIPIDTDANGYIHLTDDNGKIRILHYTSWSGSTFTVNTTDGNEDFNSVNATSGNDVYTTVLTPFQPIGLAVHRNIAYIVSVQYDINGNFVNGEIGTYPSPDWSALYSDSNNNPIFTSSTSSTFLPMLNVYSPLRNFLDNEALELLITNPPTEDEVLNDDNNYRNNFRTNLLNFPNDRLIEVEIQQSYDNSVNILFTDNKNQKRLVNSRFIIGTDSKSAAIADRRQIKDTNTYSEKRFSATRLIRNYETVPTLKFGATGSTHGVKNGGSLLGGNYKFYFKYQDSDGALTDIIEESGIVSIGFSNYGTKSEENSGKYVEFELSNLERKFTSVKVYFSYSTGGTDATSIMKEILNPFDITEEDPMLIRIYGNEPIKDIANAELNIDYSSINTVKSFTQHDDRLVDANIGNTNVDFDQFKEITRLLYIKEADETIVADYSKPENCYNYVGYWAGETYEIGIVYILTNGRGTTPVFPLVGRDNYLDTQAGIPYGGFPLNTYTNGFITSNLISQNILGCYRTSKSRINMLSGTRPSISYINGDITTPYIDGLENFGYNTNARYLSVDMTPILQTSPVIAGVTDFVNENVEGWFFVRKDRKKDCILQGWATNTAIVSKDQYFNRTAPYEYNLATLGDLSGTPAAEGSYRTFGSAQKIGMTKDYVHVKGKVIPAPGRMIDLGAENNTSIKALGLKSLFLQGIVSPDPTWNGTTAANIIGAGGLPNGDVAPTYFALYSPDVLMNPKLMASIFQGNQRGIMISTNPIKAKAYVGGYGTSVGAGGLNKQEPPIVFYPSNFNLDMNRATDYATNNVNSLIYYINEYQDSFVNGQFSSISQNNFFMDNGTSLYMDAIRYADYIGIKNVPRDANSIAIIPQFSSNLGNDATLIKHLSNAPGGVGSLIERLQTGSGINFAMPINIYDSSEGVIPYSGGLASIPDWRNKYSNINNSDSYYAITRRVSLERARNNTDLLVTTLSPIQSLFGGDCYINYTFKRLWYPSGIDSNPAAQDPVAYLENNQDSNLMDRGVIMALVCESNYNSGMRTIEKVSDPIEEGIYGSGRSFYPLIKEGVIRTSRQMESKGYNFGYNFNLSDRNHFALNNRAPSLNLVYDTRIMVSDIAVSGSFINGYTNFSGLNYKDYARNLGSITKLISHNGQLFCIQENGISIVPMQLRTLLSNDAGGIYTENSQLLGPKLQILSTEFGSDQQFSIIKTENFIYGVHLTKNKIWRIEGSQNGYNVKIISDFKIQKLLNTYKSILSSSLDGAKPFVKVNYDTVRNSVIFTYYNVYKGKFTTDLILSSSDRTNKVSTVYMSETINRWVSQLSFNPLISFNLGNELFSFNAEKEQNKIWKHYINNKYCNFYGDQHKFEFEFIVVDKPMIQKILNNLLVVCNRVFPNRVTYTIDPQIGFDNLVSTDINHIQLIKQRHENFNLTPDDIYYNAGSSYVNFLSLSYEELERIKGAYFNYSNINYIFGNIITNSNQYYIEILNENLTIISSLPGGFTINKINFNIIKQNSEYIENELNIEVGKEPFSSRVRDKAIKIKFSYNGKDYITIQQIISMFDYSFS